MRILRFKVRGLPFVCAWVLFGAGLTFELYALYCHHTTPAQLPPHVGNFPHVRALLEEQPKKKEFTFAVVGDVRSSTTFEYIATQLRKTELDFVVLLGDFVRNGNPDEHAFFRAKCAEAYALPCPVFFVAGNHDVEPTTFPVARFERDYGPSMFTLEYQGCLFVFLRVLDRPWTNEESLEYLRDLGTRELSSYRYRFVFMHIPPDISPDVTARHYAENDALITLLTKLRIDYVFSGDFHGYARVERPPTTYIVSGGGGSELKGEGGFHHAFGMRVMENGISERLLWQKHMTGFQDVTEMWAIVHVYPWLSRHAALAVAINAVLGAALLTWTARRFIRGSYA